MDDETKTGIELTICFLSERVTSMIFDSMETADMFVELTTNMLNEKGKAFISFEAEPKKIYSLKELVRECDNKGEVGQDEDFVHVMNYLDSMDFVDASKL